MSSETLLQKRISFLVKVLFHYYSLYFNIVNSFFQFEKYEY